MTDAAATIQSLRSYVEGYPHGGRIERHAHDLDQLTIITGSSAVVETEEVYVVHPCMRALWLPAGVYHSIFSPRAYYLHALYFEPSQSRITAAGVLTDNRPQVLALNNLARELALFLCEAPQPSRRGPRHAHALALLSEFLADARVDSFSLPRPRDARARKLADYLTAHASDSRALDVVAEQVGGASLRTFERCFLDETGLSLAAWRRQSRLLAALTLLTEGKSVGEVAPAVGYESAAAFSTAFKQCFGVSPSTYLNDGE